MSYFELLPIINDYLLKKDNPRILEIGIEHGTITIPMIQNLLNENKKFYYHGIDIEIKPIIHEFHKKINNSSSFNFVERNSLNELPNIKDKFDLILVDGDHNYYTVSNELRYITNLKKQDSMIVCDDYHTPWDVNDFWYDEHVSNPLATKPIKTEKSGVMPAIDEWAKEQNMTINHYNQDGVLVREDIRYCHAVILKSEV